MPPIVLSDCFEPAAYLRALDALARSDGLHGMEADFIAHQAEAFGVAREDWSQGEPDWGGLSTFTKRLVYRDCITLSELDGDVTEQEVAFLDRLRERLGLSSETAAALRDWIVRYDAILAEGEALLAGTA